MNTIVASIPVLDLDGNAVDLMKAYSNKVVLLIIYNNDCLGCTGRAIPLAYEFQQQYPFLAWCVFARRSQLRPRPIWNNPLLILS